MEDLGLHWHDREPCPLTREEGEAYGTNVATTLAFPGMKGMICCCGHATGVIDPGAFGKFRLFSSAKKNVPVARSEEAVCA